MHIYNYADSKSELAARGPKGNRFSRAQGTRTNCDDDHAKYRSQKAHVLASAATTD